ncbi:MAG: hypothetical protein JXA73_11660 [Acidobacteria bacterium]|nr:hypothetical protein [Acidobacteriota bacterium]
MITAIAYFRKIGNWIWASLGNHPLAHLTGLYIFCIIVFLLAVPLPRVDGHLVGSDGSYYYAYLPTLLLDHDLDFANQYAKLFLNYGRHTKEPSESRPQLNKYAIGPAILWTPFFLIGHLLAIGLNVAGYRIPLDGIGYIYQIPTLLGSLSYGFAGLLLIYRSCCRFYKKSASVTATILMWLATNVIYYMIAEPSMSHMCSLFAIALFLELWLAYRPTPTLLQWFILGLAGGLIGLVRQAEMTWIALPAAGLLPVLCKGWKTNMRLHLPGLAVFGMTAFLVFLPQIVLWQIQYGNIAGGGNIEGHRVFHWLEPKMIQVLFSMHHGLYIWHPLLLPATAGLILLYRKDRFLPFLLGFFFLLQVYLIGSWFGWMGGHSFGSRMMIGAFPALALGLAALVEWTEEHGALAFAGILGSGLIAWNAVFFAQYRLGYISKYLPITFEQLIPGKLVVLKDLMNRFWAMIR